MQVKNALMCTVQRAGHCLKGFSGPHICEETMNRRWHCKRGLFSDSVVVGA